MICPQMSQNTHRNIILYLRHQRNLRDNFRENPGSSCKKKSFILFLTSAVVEPKP
jgi:hypothetical protein